MKWKERKRMKKQRAERLDSSRLNLCRHFHLIEEEEEELASLPCHCCYQTTLSEVQFLGWKNVHISALVSRFRIIARSSSRGKFVGGLKSSILPVCNRISPLFPFRCVVCCVFAFFHSTLFNIHTNNIITSSPRAVVRSLTLALALLWILQVRKTLMYTRFRLDSFVGVVSVSPLRFCLPLLILDSTDSLW